MLAAPIDLVDPVGARVGGRVWLYFGGCDYLRLSHRLEIRAALRRGADRWGVNVGASRRTTGNREVYEDLERELADFFKVESAILVSSGYVTNAAVAQALSGRFSHAFIDSRAHVSLVDAAAFLGCPIIKFQHRNVADLKRQMRRRGRSLRPMVITDGLYSHNGSVAPLRACLGALPRQGVLLVDDAHGAGVLGKEGRGSTELAGVKDGRLVRTITLSKAFGVYGGVILASAEVRSLIHERSRVFVGNTPLPPALAEAALEAVRVLRRFPGLRSRLKRNIHYLRQRIRREGIPLEEHPGPILGIRPRRVESRAVIDRALRERGILPPFMFYPGGVKEGFYRFSVSSEHRCIHLRAVADALLSCREEWESG